MLAMLRPDPGPAISVAGPRRSLRRAALATMIVGALAACSGSETTDAVADDATAEPTADEAETTGSAVATSEPTDVAEPVVATTDPAAPDDSTSDVATPAIGTIVDGNVDAGEPTRDDPTIGTVVDGSVGALPIPVPGPTVAGPIEEEVDFGTGVTASIVDVEAVEVEARLPGERSGPGVIVTIEVDNGSADAISLDFVTVDLIQRDGASAIPVGLATPSGLEGDLEPGATSTGRYQFFIPVDQRVSATITVNYAADVPTALFSGDLPDV